MNSSVFGSMETQRIATQTLSCTSQRRQLVLDYGRDHSTGVHARDPHPQPVGWGGVSRILDPTIRIVRVRSKGLEGAPRSTPGRSHRWGTITPPKVVGDAIHASSQHQPKGGGQMTVLPHRHASVDAAERVKHGINLL